MIRDDRNDGALAVHHLNLDETGVRIEVSPDQAATARMRANAYERYRLAPYAANSRRLIRAGWQTWTGFCRVRGCVAMPIAFDDLHAFVEERIAAGYRRASIESTLYALDVACQLWDCPSPLTTWEWRAYWRGACRDRLIRQQQQAAPLNIEDVLAIIDRTNPENAQSVRDTALASTQYDLMARASEIVAVRWDQVSFGDDTADGGVCEIAHSKTDQEGSGVSLYLTPRTMRWLRAWRDRCNGANPYVFHALPRKGDRNPRPMPLSVREVGRIMERLRVRVGSEKAWSGHSARVGATQDMTRAGIDLAAIMQAGRWKTATMPARYAAREMATRSGRNRDRAIERLIQSDRRVGVIRDASVARPTAGQAECEACDATAHELSPPT